MSRKQHKDQVDIRVFMTWTRTAPPPHPPTPVTLRILKCTSPKQHFPRKYILHV